MKKWIDKIVSWLSHWPKDKVLHFVMCLIITIVAGCLAKMCGASWAGIIASGWFAGMLAGIAKEIYDEWDTAGSDEGDWAADAVGIVLGMLFLIIMVA